VIGLDTNVLIRFLAQDDDMQSARATALIGTLTGSQPGFVSTVVLIELVWVMRRAYGATKPELIAILDSLFRMQELVIQERDMAFGALRTFAGTKADFADCLIARMGRQAGCTHTVTFDKAAASAGEMQLLS
jgi:predicted nucleic-acid-binding protein